MFVATSAVPDLPTQQPAVVTTAPQTLAPNTFGPTAVVEDITTIDPFEEFSTMNPMKLLIMAMKKLKEMEHKEIPAFSDEINDTINEIGDELVDVIPENLSASDNLLVLEPIKKGAVINVGDVSEVRTADGIKIVDFSRPRYY